MYLSRNKKKYCLTEVFSRAMKNDNTLTLKQESHFFVYFSEKIKLDISCESSARQAIHMKCQILFSLKNLYEKV